METTEQQVRHTPGPWRVVQRMQGHRDVFTVGPSYQPSVAVLPFLEHDRRQQEVNAHAIAALPELLEACRAVQAVHLPEDCPHGNEPDYCDGCLYETQKAMVVARKQLAEAIAKAEGR